MSWFKSETVATAPPAGANPKPVAVPVAVELEKLELKEYRRVAQSLGLENPAFDKIQLFNTLKELGIPIFPYGNVRDYLDKLFGPYDKEDQRHPWSWRPLRRGDVHRTGLRDSDHSGFYTPSGGDVFTKIYTQPVPLGVLLTAEKIQRAIPEVGLFVSDARGASDVKDPFLAISLAGLAEMIVVEVWDEPGFKR